MEKYQELIDKVSEFRHSKVKQRQINKFNWFIEKEGNITWLGTPSAQVGSTFPWAARVSSSKAGSTLPLQLGLVLPRQLASVPPKQVALLPRQLVHTFPRQAALIPSEG